MNELLYLKGKFEQKDNTSKVGHSNIPKDQCVTLKHLVNLKHNLQEVKLFWDNNKLQIKPLVSVYYYDVVAKSNRIKALLENGINNNNKSVVGVKFSQDGIKHIITHCIESRVIVQALKKLEIVENLVKQNFGTSISYEKLAEINNGKYEHLFKQKGISKSNFVNLIVDAYYVEELGIEQNIIELQENSIVTIYDTGTKTTDIMKQLDIDFSEFRTINETTLLLTPNQFAQLKLKAPYLIAMAVSDISKLDGYKLELFEKNTIMSIPSPSNEPTIGVIDTMFDTNVYFSEWVEFKNLLDSNIPLSNDDYKHGTAVSSLIVDGPSLNPSLDDGCGRFKVRHFGVAKNKTFSSFTVLKLIQEIVVSNPDIKVWNLSLGSSLEINPNFISPEAAILDTIQFEREVIFVIAGTNKPYNSNVIKKIGAPADSINSLVVNSVGPDNNPAPYSREGGVLSFYNKPDVSYYGGVTNSLIRVCEPLGEAHVAGTSFAAPWIARKLAYLIEVIGLSREIAKALLIDSAAGWNNQEHSPQLIGFGVVPKHINEILYTPDDEIKFMIDGISEKYDTYNYNIPVPVTNDKQPFVAKATLCYFPNCSRNQGVDYTNTEMDLHFGRLKGKNNIRTINDNKQSDEVVLSLYENSARKFFRKWDNVKHIRENYYTEKGLSRRAKSHTNPWAISIRTKERLNTRDGENLKFGLVITLKEINGKNRIQDFIQECFYRNWLVDRVIVKNRVELYNIISEDVILE